MNRTATRTHPARNVRAHDFKAQVSQLRAPDRAALVQAIDRQDMAELEREQIACRIKQARKEAGLTQPEMAEALGVIQRTYQNYESVKEPRTPWGLMNDIAKITGKSTEWLIHGDKATPDLMAAIGGTAEDGSLREQLDRIEAEQGDIRSMLIAVLAHLEADVALASAEEEQAANAERHRTRRNRRAA